MAVAGGGRGTRPHGRPAGTHPPALPVQQHEHHRGTDPQRPGARGRGGAGSRGPFRASLDERRGLIPLTEELEAARTYQRIEQQRLGERLQVRWQVDGLPQDALMPALTLQPLLENAIGHGIENLPGGGAVTVTGSAAAGTLLLTVRNPLPLDGTAAGGADGRK